MAGTRTGVVTEARVLTRDTDATAYVVAAAEMNRYTDTLMETVADRIGLPLSWVTSAVTLVAGTYDYTLTSTSEYASVIRIQCHDNGEPLVRRTPQEIEQLRQGTTAAQGRPSDYAPRPSATQTYPIRVWPTPDAAAVSLVGTLDALVTTVPAALAADGDAVPLGIKGLRGLALLVASRAIRLLPPDQVMRLTLNPGLADTYERDAAALIQQERLTIIRLKRAHGGRWMHAWLS